MNQTGLTWQDPPGHQNDWPAVAEQLRAHPGRWALIAETIKTSTVNGIRQGGVNALLPQDGFQIRTTNNTRERPRTCSLYMRWQPPEG